MFLYHRKLSIIIMCETEVLKETILSADFPENFEYTLTCIQGGELLEKGDIIFFDGNSVPASQLRQKYGPEARLVLCSSQTFAEALPDEEIQCINRLWEVPLTPRVTAKRFRRVLEEIHTEKEYFITRNCLDAAIDTLPDMLWFKSADGIHTKVNKAFCGVVGKTREDVTGKDHCYIWDVSREEFENGAAYTCQESEEQVMREKRTCQFSETVKGQHGLRQFKTYKSPVFDEDGTILGTVGIGHDVTALQNLDAELEIVLNSMPYSILMKNEKGVVIDVNSRFEKNFKVKKDEMLGKEYSVWFEKTFDESTMINKEGCFEITTRNGVIAEIYDEPILDVFENVVGELIIYRDVTRIRVLEKQILRSSNTDFLTGLDNRRSFYRYIRDNRKDKMISILCIDLDFFKVLNDTYGHQAGDDALVKVSNLFRQYFKGDFIARFGGDEFVIAILGPCNIEEIKERIAALQAGMAEISKGSEHMSMLTLSAGISQTDDPNMDIDLLINQGDTALYEAKQNGKNRCCVFSEL